MTQQSVDNVVVPLRGELDIAVAHQIRGAGLRVLGAGARTVTFDLHDTTFVDAQALSALVDVQRAAADQGAALRVRNVPARILRVFDMTGLTAPLAVTAEPA